MSEKIIVEDKLEQIFNSLTGKYKHYCCEWDLLPIDETCEEFEACLCYPEVIRVRYLKRLEEEIPF